jgi:hypothetical protein
MAPMGVKCESATRPTHPFTCSTRLLREPQRRRDRVVRCRGRLNEQTREGEKIADGHDGIAVRQLHALAGVPAAGLIEVRIGIM